MMFTFTSPFTSVQPIVSISFYYQNPIESMKSFYFLYCLIFVQATHVYGQFSGNYAPSNWTVTTTPGSDGSVNTGSAPTSITITGSDNGSSLNADTDFTISATASGVWSFAWAYHTNDDPQYDNVGVLINGVYTQLSNDGGAIDQSGTYNGASVPAGTVIGFRVRATDDVGGNATFTISSFSGPATTLPVSSLEFSAQKIGNKVSLQWSTEKEENTEKFEVQQSTNGNQFNTIKTVAAQGSSLVPASYSTVDAAPADGYNYYRLRVVDWDGATTFSKIVLVKIGNQNNLKIHPTEAGSSLSITLSSLRAHEESLAIYTASGALVKQITVYLIPGENTITVPLAAFSKGHYFIKTLSHGGTARFIKK